MLINPNKGDLYLENNNYYKYVSSDEGMRFNDISDFSDIENISFSIK